MKIGLLTVSDRGARGEYEDRSGPLMAQIIHTNTPWEISHRSIIPDDLDTIANTLVEWSEDGLGPDLNQRRNRLCAKRHHTGSDKPSH